MNGFQNFSWQKKVKKIDYRANYNLRLQTIMFCMDRVEFADGIYAMHYLLISFWKHLIRPWVFLQRNLYPSRLLQYSVMKAMGMRNFDKICKYRTIWKNLICACEPWAMSCTITSLAFVAWEPSCIVVRASLSLLARNCARNKPTGGWKIIAHLAIVVVFCKGNLVFVADILFSQKRYHVRFIVLLNKGIETLYF